jgi:hypothetical protein
MSTIPSSLDRAVEVIELPARERLWVIGGRQASPRARSAAGR